MISLPTRSNAIDPRVSVARRVVASYNRYSDAEVATHRLAAMQFPVDRAMIVGRGLEVVQTVTGMVTPRIAAARGALLGLVSGALVGWLLGLFNVVDPLVASSWLAVNAALLGAVVGTAVSLLVYLVTRGRRRFTSIAGTRAQNYDVLVDADLADRAARVIADGEPSAGSDVEHAASNSEVDTADRGNHRDRPMAA